MTSSDHGSRLGTQSRVESLPSVSERHPGCAAGSGPRVAVRWEQTALGSYASPTVVAVAVAVVAVVAAVADDMSNRTKQLLAQKREFLAQLDASG